MTVIVDASALVKLVLNEEHSIETADFFNKCIMDDNLLKTSDIALAEVLNAIFKHRVLIKDLKGKNFETAVENICAVLSKIEKAPTETIAGDAVKMAVDNNIAVYDALYLTLAKIDGAQLFTFDKKLAERAKAIGVELVEL